MKIYDALNEFLHDQNYFVTLIPEKMYVYQYQEIKKIKDSEIVLSIDNFLLVIKGSNLCIKKMCNKELLIEGKIEEIKKNYE